MTPLHVNLLRRKSGQTLVSMLLLRLQAGLANPTEEFIGLSHKSVISRFMNSCNLVGDYERCGGIYCFHIQDIRWRNRFTQNAVNHLP